MGLATIRNECGHHACEDCWHKWITSQVTDPLERAAVLRRASTSGALPCFGFNCQNSMEAGLWQYFCMRSDDISLVDKQMAIRRRLESNSLYPSAMQADCPMPACFGLGYLGFDTAMCFVCEHQWTPANPGAAPCDIDASELMGVK